MNTLFNKFLCALFLPSYFFLSLAMEDPDDEKKEYKIGTTIVPITFSYHDKQAAHYFETPELEYQDDYPISKDADPEEKENDNNMLEWSKSDESTSRNFLDSFHYYQQSHDTALHNLMAQNKQSEQHKYDIHYHQSPLDQLYFPGVNEDTYNAAQDYNKKQSNQGKKSRDHYYNNRTSSSKNSSQETHHHEQNYLNPFGFDNSASVYPDKNTPAQENKSSQESSQSNTSKDYGSQASNPSKQESSSKPPLSINQWGSFLEGKQSSFGSFREPGSHQTTSESVEIDESEFANLPKPPPLFDTDSSKHISSTNASSQKKHQERSSHREFFQKDESFSGLDNVPWRDYEAEKRTAEEKDRQRKAQTYTDITSFLNNGRIPSSFREQLHDIVDENIQGKVDFEQTEAQFHGIQKNYRQVILNNLRIQGSLSPELADLRRQLEREFVSEEDQTLLHSEEYKNIKKEKKEDKDKNIYSWDIFRPSKLQNLNDKYEEKKKEHRNKSLDSISERYKKQFDAQEKQLKRIRKAEIKKKQEIQRRVKQIKDEHNKDKKTSQGLKYLYPNNELSSTPGIQKSDNPTFADTELIIVDENFNPSLDLTELSLDSLDLVTTTRTHEYLNIIGMDPKEFANFNGSAEQNTIQNELNDHLNYITSHKSFLEDTRNAGFFNYHNDLIKAAFDLNRDNHVTFAKIALTVAKDLTLAALWDYEYPIKECGAALLNNIMHPIDTFSQAAGGIKELFTVLTNHAKHNPRFG